MLKKLPIQPAGWVVFGVGVASLVGALALNWRELLVLAIGCAAILVLSLLFIIGRSDVELTRRLVPDRVTIGDSAIAELHAVNRASTRSSRQTIHESLNGKVVPIALPSLRQGEQTVRSWEPPTHRRGVHLLGPARITKADPCRLMQRNVSQTGVDKLWVQPRVMSLGAFPGGVTKDIDGPTFDHSPAGDVAFHAIRPYQLGDDVRHVHWMATARAGDLMVRHYVDNRQPYLSVLIDTNVSSWASLDEFDAAIDIAASLGVSAIERSHPVSVHAGEKALVGRQFRSTRQQLLDDLTLVDTDAEFDLARAMVPLVSAERNSTVVLLLTGTGEGISQLAAPSATLARTYEVLLVRVGETDDGADLSGAGSVGRSDADHHDDDLIVGRGVTFIEVADLEALAKRVAQRVIAA